MTVTLVLPEQVAEELFQSTASDVESAGVLLAKYVETPGGGVRLLARAMHWVPDDAYRVRNAVELSIPPMATCLPWLLRRLINVSRYGCTPIPAKGHRHGRAYMTKLSTRRLPKSSGSGRVAGFTGPLFWPVLEASCVSPVTSKPRRGATTLTAYGFPAVGSPSLRVGSTSHDQRRTSSTGTFAPLAAPSRICWATFMWRSLAVVAPGPRLLSNWRASASAISS